MRMLKDNILVQPLSKEQLGKVVLPDSVEDVWKRGKVIQVGPDVQGNIKPDDILIFPPFFYGGPYPQVGNDGYIIVQENVIWAIED